MPSRSGSRSPRRGRTRSPSQSGRREQRRPRGRSRGSSDSESGGSRAAVKKMARNITSLRLDGVAENMALAAAGKLEQMGINVWWAVKNIDIGSIDTYVPQSSDMAMNVLLKEIVRKCQGSENPGSGQTRPGGEFAEFCSAQTEAFKTLAKSIKKDQEKNKKKRHSKRNSSSSSPGGDDDKEFVKVHEALKSYNLAGIGFEFLPDPQTLAREVEWQKETVFDHRVSGT